MARKSQVDVETLALASEKLASSGLDLDDAEVLGIDLLPPAKTQALHPTFKPVPSLRFNYFSPDGKPMSAWPSWPPFYRLRYLKVPADFSALTDKKQIRYVQEPDSGVCAYFPQIIDWQTVVGDPRTPIIITEGELKSAKACKEGYETIGLGGVHNFRSAKLGITFLTELEKIRWTKRYVYIVFDSDFRANELVCQAMNEIAEQLMLRGAIPFVTPLPDLDPKHKTGLDDFLVAHPATELGALIRDTSVPLTLARSLWKLNDKVIYVYKPGLVVIRETRQKISPSQFKDHAFSTIQHSEQIVRDNGSISLKPVSASKSWLEWPLRNEVGSLTYAPGKPEIINGSTSMAGTYNTWLGWGVEPKKGDVKPFLKLVDHLFTDAAKEDKTWFLRWCAYPIQFPGVKMFSSVVVHGRRHGTGKSLIGYTLGKIYGENFTEIKQTDLHSNFNEWAENKQFVLGDDVSGSDRRADADMLKKLITQKSLRLNPKYIPSYTVPDCINYMWTSNQPDAFFLEDDDRRFFIHEVQVGPLAEEFYADYDLWLDSGGAAAVFHWLMSLDLGDFNPAAPARRTTAKDRMTEDVRSDLATWVRNLVKNPDDVLRVGAVRMIGDLFSNRQLLQLYDPEGRTRTTANGLGRELSRAGVAQVLEGVPMKTESGQDRFYIIRNAEKWKKATREQVRAHLDQQEKKRRGKPRY